MLAINAHTHLYSGLAPLGMPTPDHPPSSFIEILEQVWWRLDRALDAEALRASVELYLLDAVGFGCTGLIDHHESPNLIDGSLDIIADACEKFGMPAVLTYGVTERNSGRDEAIRGLGECKRFIENNQRRLCRGMVGVHASFTVSDETLREAGQLARDLGVGIHMHVAEDSADVADAKKRGYGGVIDRLAKNDALIEGSVFAHGVHLTRAEVERCEASAIWLVQNPRSNKGNGVGYPPNLSASSLVALGTDGYPADMSAEAAALRLDAELASDDLEKSSERLAAGERLFEGLFGEKITDASATLDPALVADIRNTAVEQAPRLWERMQSI